MLVKLRFSIRGPAESVSVTVREGAYARALGRFAGRAAGHCWGRWGRGGRVSPRAKCQQRHLPAGEGGVRDGGKLTRPRQRPADFFVVKKKRNRIFSKSVSF